MLFMKSHLILLVRTVRLRIQIFGCLMTHFYSLRRRAGHSRCAVLGKHQGKFVNPVADPNKAFLSEDQPLVPGRHCSRNQPFWVLKFQILPIEAACLSLILPQSLGVEFMSETYPWELTFPPSVPSFFITPKATLSLHGSFHLPRVARDGLRIA